MLKDKYSLLVVFLYILTLLSFYFIEINNYEKVILYIVDFCICFALGLVFFLRNKAGKEFSFKEIVFIALGLRIIVMFVNPITSDDYYRYLWDGKVQAEGLNPFQYSPEELTQLHDDIIYPKVTYPDIKTIYPPLSQVVFYLGYLISGANAIGLKLLYLFFTAGILYFLFNSLKLLKINTNYIFLYVLSPLVIFEFFINAHIDIVILFFISAFIYFTLSGNTGPAFLFLSLSILSKTYSLIFLPLFVYHLYRSGMSVKNIFLQSFYFFLPMLLLTFYGSSIGNIYFTMQNYMQNWYSNNLIFLSLNSLMHVFDIYDHHIARLIMIVFFLIAYIFILKSKLTIIQKLYLVSFFYLFFAHTVHQWYVTLIVLFLPLCFSYSALYWSGIIGLTNITVFYFLRDNVWKDFLPVLIAEYVVLALLIVLDIRRFYLPQIRRRGTKALRKIFLDFHLENFMSKNALIIFARNPELGKVKNRLAKTIGKEKALEIYSKLLFNVYTETKSLKCNKYLFLTERTDTALFDDTYIQKIQSGVDLGDKMLNAFKIVFEDGNEKAVVIGTDVPGLNEEIINEAFQKLSDKDIVIGPAKDGGYYLIGMKESLSSIFENMKWSNDQVLNNTIERIRNLNKSYSLVEELVDIDTEEDLKQW